MLGACLDLCFSLIPTPPLIRDHPLFRDPAGGGGRTGRSGEVDPQYRNPAELSPFAPPNP